MVKHLYTHIYAVAAAVQIIRQCTRGWNVTSIQVIGLCLGAQCCWTGD